MIKVKGNLLVFDKPDIDNRVFPKHCKVTIPGEIPIIAMGGDPFDSSVRIGVINSTKRNDQGITIEGYINGRDEEIYATVIKDPGLYFGGFYRIGDRHTTADGMKVFESLDLRSVGVYAADPYGREKCLKIEIVEDDHD